LKNALARIALVLAFALIVFAMLVGSLNTEVGAYTFSGEYQEFVHTYLNSGIMGNWTYIEKPMFPVSFNTSQIQIGKNWTVMCPLEANHSYHIYYYGKFINNGSEPKTDYDIYVYDPLGEMVGYHTPSAGLPPHLGSTVDDPFFVPKYSGNYTFVISNNAIGSSAAEQATFMIIEDVECNVWNEHFVEGMSSNDSPALNTSWAYEFTTESKNIEVWIEVPTTLDMYEARLYLMADSKSANETVLNGVPLAWEPGLYGNRSSYYGGYNIDSKGYRGNAFSSCEFYGQDMFINYTAPNSGQSLYHLVLIGEKGSGTIQFLIKTEFDNASLKPLTIPQRVCPNNDTVISYISNSTDLENATLQYSTNGRMNFTTINMNIVNNRTCTATVPKQQAGTIVNYTVKANDTMENVLTAIGSYPVKDELVLNFTVTQEIIILGENITVRGNATYGREQIPIIVDFNSANDSKEITCYTNLDGTFAASFKPETIGTWIVQARFDGDSLLYASDSQLISVNVVEPSFFVKYSLYIGALIGAVLVTCSIIYWRKSKTS
jgi:hypothetical protein